MVDNETWNEFMVETPGPLGFDIRVCGLCGNTGVVDTTKNPPIAPYGKPVTAMIRPCICPNGRSVKKDQDKQLES